MNATVRPEFITDEMLEYLDDLRESGATNMFGAGSYLESEFPELLDGATPRSYKSCPKAAETLRYWMNTFGQPNR